MSQLDPNIERDGFCVKDNCYYAARSTKGKNSIKVCISNFTMMILYLFPNGTSNAKRIFRINNKTGHEDILEIPSGDLSLQKFKAAIRSRGNYSFRGTQYDLDLILEYLQAKERIAEEIEILGYQPKSKCYAFSNGLLDPNGNFIPVDEYGVVTFDDKSYYLPAFSKINEYSDAFTNSKKYLYRQGNSTFWEVAELFYNAYGSNGAIGICFLIASLFRDIAFSTLNYFPFLFLFGGTGRGKTSFTELLLALFGKNILGISLEGDSSSKSFARIISQLRNAILYFKEYTNAIETKMAGFLKSAYEGVGYDRAQMSNDNKTHQTQVLSAIIIDGNELPVKKSALFSRTILLSFNDDIFGTKETEAYKKLEVIKAAGMGMVIKEILSCRKLVNDQFDNTFSTIFNQLKYDKLKGKGLSDRSIQHIACLMTPAKIVATKLKFPFDINCIMDTVIAYAIKQHELLNQIREVSVFWQAVEYLNGEMKIRNNEHFLIKNDGQESSLYLKYEKVYPLYNDYCNKQRLVSIDKSSLLELLKVEPYFISSQQKGRVYTHTLRDFGSCYRFKYEDLNINLDDSESSQ